MLRRLRFKEYPGVAEVLHSLKLDTGYCFCLPHKMTHANATDCYAYYGAWQDRFGFVTWMGLLNLILVVGYGEPRALRACRGFVFRFYLLPILLPPGRVYLHRQLQPPINRLISPSSSFCLNHRNTPYDTAPRPIDRTRTNAGGR